jgi:hypothetical protein
MAKNCGKKGLREAGPIAFDSGGLTFLFGREPTALMAPREWATAESQRPAQELTARKLEAGRTLAIVS